MSDLEQFDLSAISLITPEMWKDISSKQAALAKQVQAQCEKNNSAKVEFLRGLNANDSVLEAFGLSVEKANNGIGPVAKAAKRVVRVRGVK